VKILKSQNIKLLDNIVWDHRPIGITFDESNSITAHGNIVGHILKRRTF
jgi:hypothetical protein